MKAVIDTMVLLRAAINPRSPWGRLLAEAGKSYTIVTSPPILRELLDVLTRSGLRRRYPQLDAALIERVLPVVLSAAVVHPVEAIDVSRDPKDNKLFECAVAGGAEYIVSEDRDILDVGEYEGVITLSAARFLETLEKERR